jgi:probable rRNA maturation factor
MSELHRRFMNVSGPTDVLTFPIELDARGRALGGEVYVCVPEARRGAKSHGTRVADEVLLYALHGMLHLCGFDDRTPAEFQRMHRTEDRILTRIGLGAVFNPARPSKPRLADAFARRGGSARLRRFARRARASAKRATRGSRR